MISDEGVTEEQFAPVLGLVTEIVARYRLAALELLLSSTRAVAALPEINVAVMGRFKAGKSSLLNHLLGYDLLPVGVIPVTSVITELLPGRQESATVHFLDGHCEKIECTALAQFVGESGNPANTKQVAKVSVELPHLARFAGLRFIDTPGLDSALAHNTAAALNWLPQVGLALVTVSVDPPLSQQDIALVRTLLQVTPNIFVVLTKADLLNETERNEVIAFIQAQLTQVFGTTPRIFPYSIRPGYEAFRVQLEAVLRNEVRARLETQRIAIIQRKLATLLDECESYLSLALQAATVVETERARFQQQTIGAQEIEEVKAELRLIIQQATSATRAGVAKQLAPYQAAIETRLCTAFQATFYRWPPRLQAALQSFEQWLARALAEELAALSHAESAHLMAPAEKVRKQIHRMLQNYREVLSARTERIFGVALRTSEAALHLVTPQLPDIRLGKVFDRNWEIFSPLLPMVFIKRIVARHFVHKIPWMVEKNLSRLTTQWAESMNMALAQLQQDGAQRLDEFVATITGLLMSTPDDTTLLKAYLARITLARSSLRIAVPAQAEH